jgi:hypothetical protein
VLKRIYTSLQVVFFISSGIAAVMIFAYSFFYLHAQGRTETKIEENVVLRFNQPTEYLEGDAFWWLMEGSNIVNIVNFSNEKHTGFIKINLQQNPCSTFQATKFSNSTIDFDKTANSLLVQEPFSISPYEKKSFDLQILNSKKCKVNNGDTREFGAKLVGWSIQ